MTDGDRGARAEHQAPALEAVTADAAPAGRGGSTSGWIVKILLLGARRRAGHRRAASSPSRHEAWGYAAVLGVTLVALNVVYLPRRYVPMKYLLPGVFFLAVFGIYPVLYTAYASIDELRHRARAHQGPGDRPDPEPVGAAGRKARRATTPPR